MLVHRRVKRPAVAIGLAFFSFALMASRPPAETLYTVRVEDGTSVMTLLSEPMTVQQRMLDSRIRLTRYDDVVPPLTTVIRRDMTVKIVRGEPRVHALSPSAGPTGFREIYTDRMPSGARVKLYTHRPGAASYDADPTLDNRVHSSDVVLVGSGREVPKQKIFHLTATAYSPDVRDCWPYKDGITALGLRAGYGVVAVDPRLIPLGTRVYVEGYGYAIAADKGGAIKGRRIDVCFDTHEEAKVYGRRPVKVYLLD